jgi:hypothetical protein
VVADAFDNSNGAGVAHGKALARDAAEVALALMAPYSTVLPTMMESSGMMPDSSGGRTMMRRRTGPCRHSRCLRRSGRGDALGDERTEALAGGAAQSDRDGVVRQAGMAVTLATSPDSMAPVDRSTLRIGRSMLTGFLFSSAGMRPSRSACGRGCPRL